MRVPDDCSHWDLGSRGKLRAWPHLATKVRELHARMWGVPQEEDDAPWHLAQRP
jgi:hypothetical protein